VRPMVGTLEKARMSFDKPLRLSGRGGLLLSGRATHTVDHEVVRGNAANGQVIILPAPTQRRRKSA
jgi:hypothetical protein